MDWNNLIYNVMKKKKKVVEVAKKVVEKVELIKEQLTPIKNTDKVDAFKAYLKNENPDWFRDINYSSNTVIDRFREVSKAELTKPDYRDFCKVLAELDSNFK